jgi:hypothetical protein
MITGTFTALQIMEGRGERRDFFIHYKRYLLLVTWDKVLNIALEVFALLICYATLIGN